MKKKVDRYRSIRLSIAPICSVLGNRYLPSGGFFSSIGGKGPIRPLSLRESSQFWPS